MALTRCKVYLETQRKEAEPLLVNSVMYECCGMISSQQYELGRIRLGDVKERRVIFEVFKNRVRL